VAKRSSNSHSIHHLPFCLISLEVQAPAVMVPSDDQFWSKERPGLPDIAFLKNHFYREGRLTEEQALYIIQKGTEILHKEPNLLEVGAPITGKAAIATS
jgi:serine/threonine-protein phosphatase 2B catalytic subunit